jgi:hypothetical protein
VWRAALPSADDGADVTSRMSTTMGWLSLSHGARERIASSRIAPAAPRRFDITRATH